jgi:hypothetical protein
MSKEKKAEYTLFEETLRDKNARDPGRIETIKEI